MIEAGLIASYVTAWAVRQAGRGIDAGTGAVIETSLGKLFKTVAAKLSGHPVMGDVRDEAASAAEQDGAVSELTRQQLELALLAAARKDESFARALTDLLAQVKAGEQACGQTVLGAGGTAIAGDVSIQAERGSVAAWHIDEVDLRPFSAESVDPPEPGRSCD